MDEPVPYLDLVESHGGGDQPLLVLTDEELAAVSGDLPEERNAIRLTALDELSDSQVDAVMDATLRSLAARQLVSEGPSDDPSGVTLHEDLAIVTGARADAVAITTAERRVAEGSRAFAVYAQSDGAALIDQAEAGVHVLHLVAAEQALTALATFLDPQEGADDARDGEVIEGDSDDPPPAWQAIVDAAGGDAASLVATSHEGTTALAVFPTGDALWVVGSLEEDAHAVTTRVRASQLGVDSFLSLLAVVTGFAVLNDDTA